VALAWLNWQLRGDAKAGALFVGDNCGLCNDEHLRDSAEQDNVELVA